MGTEKNLVELEELGLNVKDATSLQFVLRKQLLPIKGTNLSYQIGKNLNKLDKFLEDVNKRLKDLHDAYTDKDTKSEPIPYLLDDTGKSFKRDANGNKIVAPTTDVIYGYFTDVNNPEYIKTRKKINEERFNDFHKIPESTIKSLADAGMLDGIDMSLFFESIIDKNL